MNAPSDGGPAFPRDERYPGHNGMTLRDYFAAKAMQGEIVSQGLEGREVEHIAAMSYEMADAMLKAREARP